MKVKILALDELTNEVYYTDGYVDENSIVACYFTAENIEEDSINLIVCGGSMTVLRNNNVMNFLLDKFPEMYKDA